MTKKKIILIALILVFVGVVGRLVPHLWNFTPIIAIGLFAGVYLGRRYMVVLPLIAMFISDIFLGFYDSTLMLTVYGSFALVGVFSYLIREKKNIKNIIFASVSASTLFFLITNFVIWKTTSFYDSSITGLYQSYTLALPFFRNMLTGDLVYTGVLFGIYEFAISGIPRLWLKQVYIKPITNVS